MRIVETCGVRKRGWTRPRLSGIAPARAIDSDVRAVGRIVVCVDAAAEVSTAMITILSRLPSTSPASRPRASPDSSFSIVLVPAKAIAAVATST